MPYTETKRNNIASQKIWLLRVSEEDISRAISKYGRPG